MNSLYYGQNDTKLYESIKILTDRKNENDPALIFNMNKMYEFLANRFKKLQRKEKTCRLINHSKYKYYIKSSEEVGEFDPDIEYYKCHVKGVF